MSQVDIKTPCGLISFGHGMMSIFLKILLRIGKQLMHSSAGWAQSLLLYPNRSTSTRTNSRNCYWELLLFSGTWNLPVLWTIRKLQSLNTLPTVAWTQMMLIPLQLYCKLFLIIWSKSNHEIGWV